MSDKSNICHNYKTVTTCIEMGCGQGASAPQAAPMPDDCSEHIAGEHAYHSGRSAYEAASFGPGKTAPLFGDLPTYTQAKWIWYAALSAAPVSEQPQEASTAQPDSERDARLSICNDTRFMAALDGYMDAVTNDERNSERRIKQRLAIFSAADAWGAALAAPQDAQERDATKLRHPLCGGAGNVGEEPEL
jgi:hypothetical protein